ncbi:MAG: hypothetical protein BVN33_06110 [Proteobacteria bacterium ST_bin13]|nr:MAG: hypothetical protein BVN33_06110 [Proteobacteria bacterium ST_bin13]
MQSFEWKFIISEDYGGYLVGKPQTLLFWFQFIEVAVLSPRKLVFCSLNDCILNAAMSMTRTPSNFD